jgi:large repetitive protein
MTLRRLVARFALTAFIFATSLIAKDRPNYDALANSPESKDLSADAKEKAEKLVKHGSTMQMEKRLGVPSFLFASAEAAQNKGGKAGATPEEGAARGHMVKFASLYHLDEYDLATAEVKGIHNTGKGAVIVQLRQRVDGVEVFRDEMKVVMNQKLDLVAMSGYIPTWTKNRTGSFTLTPDQAIALAFQDLTDAEIDSSSLEWRERRDEFDLFALNVQVENSVSLHMAEPSRVKKVMFDLPEGLEPAYYLELSVSSADSTDSDFYGYVISAVDGRLLFRNNLTAQDSFSYRVWADSSGQFIPFDGPQGTTGTPHPTGLPDGFQAPFVSPQLVTLQNSPFSKNDPWLPPGATQTIGNNVEAYADLVTPDGFTATGDFHADVTSPNVFDYTYDTALGPQSSLGQQKAAIVQLFFMNNFLHDWYYDSGFDEAAGNAQTSNFGRGGRENDNIRAEGQDFSGRNNANMSTPADGGRPRMQMFIFNGNAAHTLTVNTPTAFARNFSNGTAAFGPQAFDVTAPVVQANPADGCAAIVNVAEVAGKIAFTDRGTCNFNVKIQNAQLAGAVGVIVANVDSSADPETAPAMGGTATIPVTIGSLSLGLSDGNLFRTNFAGGIVARLFREVAVDRDGTIDNQVIAHEWGHYISNRLVGNASGLNTNMSRGMGEGWGDFHAMLLTVRPEDALVPSNANYNGVYGIAGYVTSGGGNNGYYFGIRRVPYSTDMTKDPLTFKHISNGVPISGAPIAFGANGANNAEVHNTGEVWTTMLWECYAALLRDTLGSSPRLTFREAQDRMKDYLVTAYKLTPNSPTFLEARDAVLAAVFANDPTDFVLFAKAFAKRGAGIRAVSPNRFSATNSPGLVESFVSGNDVEFVNASLTDGFNGCDRDGALDNGETGILSIRLKNSGTGQLTATTATISSTNPNVSFPTGNVFHFVATQPFDTVTGQVPIHLEGASGIEIHDLKIDLNDPDLALGPPPANVLSARGNFDVVPNQSASDDVESPSSPWATAGTTANVWARSEITASDHRWLGPDPGQTSDQSLISPILQVGTDTFSFTFIHRFGFEFTGTTFFDGGVIEISTDGGTTWTDIGNLASPAYNGTLVATGTNPLRGRKAYVANQTTQVPVTVSLGTTFANQAVRIRFRTASDVTGSGFGWEIDNLSFSGITNTPFPILVPDRGLCVAVTKTTLATSGTPSTYGQSVTFSSLVSANNPAEGVPTGTLAFQDGPATLGLGTLDGTGNTSFSTSTLGAGSHQVQAFYGADSFFKASTSPVVTQVVNQAGTATSLSSSLNPARRGDAVTFFATVAPKFGGTVTGTVQFIDIKDEDDDDDARGDDREKSSKNGADNDKHQTVLGVSAVDSSGHATFTTSNLKNGKHLIIAVYSGDNNLIGSTSQTIKQQVKGGGDKKSSLRTLSPNATYRGGEAVTLDAMLRPSE